MDICRLVLERCERAKSGANLICSLVEQYGQGGNCGFDKTFYYDNSYIVADSEEAYVVETVGRLYAVKKVEDLYAISNQLTIQRDWDYAS